MDLDNITDIEVLRTALKRNMIKAKTNFYSEDKKYYFRKDHWYWVDMCFDWGDVTVFSDDFESTRTFRNFEAQRFLYAN